MATLFDRMFSRVKSTFADGLWLAPKMAAGNFLSLMSSDTPSPQKLSEENKNWAAACIDAVAQNVAGIELQLHRYGKDGKVEVVAEHEALDVLAYVNEVMSQFELFEITGQHLSLYGNALWLLDGVSDNGKGKPRAIYPLNPRFVKVIRKPLPGGIERYEYRIDNKVWNIKPEQIIHFRTANPDDPFWGKGKLEKALDSVQADFWTRAWAKAFFRNGGKVDGVIEVPTALSPDQAKQLLDVWNMRHQGVNKAHRTAVIPLGGKYQEHGSTVKDMDFANLRQVSRDEILAMFGVPKSVLGIVEDVNRANAEASNFVFADRTIKPMMRKITDALNEFFIPFYGDNVWLTFRDPTPENRLEELEVMKAALGGKPWMSVNEVRAKLNLPPIEDGDAVMTDFAAIPLGEPKPQDDPTKTAPRKRMAKTKAMMRGSSVKRVGGDLAQDILNALADAKTKAKEQADLDEAEHKRFQVAIAPFIRSTERALVALGEDQEKEVLRALPDLVKGMVHRLSMADPRIKAVDPDDFFDDEVEISIMSKKLKPIFAELMKLEGSAVLEKITGQAFDERDKRVQDALDHAIGLLSKEYTRTTKEELRDALEIGLGEGEGIDKLAKRVEGVYKVAETSRAKAVALTETNRIGNQAALQAMKQSGVVKTIRWYTGPSDVCEFCQEMSGTVEDINSAFFDKGDTITANGSEMELDYDVVETPPLHPNCHCYVRPETIETP